MADETELSIDEIRLWTVSALKDFLLSRNLKVSARKDELVALVYGAKIMMQVPAPPATSCSAARAEAEKKGEYADLLKTPTGTIPDPKNLVNWESEEKGVTKWPPTMAFEIADYLNNIDDVDLRSRLMADYKDQKAYSYFASSSGWIGEVEYNEISHDNNYCALRSECNQYKLTRTPSQRTRIRDVPWKVWVTVEKKSGKIHSAYCTCFAGFSKTCNHIAALLFKVDFAWQHGLSNPACTSLPCGWSPFSFSGQHAFQPKRISEMTWSKQQFSKQGSSKGRSTSDPTSLETLTHALYPFFQDAAVFQYMDIETPQKGSQSNADICADVNYRFSS